jgi:hypothetical protein
MGCCNGYDFAPAPDAALDPGQRVNFSFGMVLGVDDFRQEHAFLAERDTRALRELIGYGAISGLEVSSRVSGSQVEVRVAPGLALLPDGKLVAVAADQCAWLDDWLAGPGNDPARSGPASVYIVLRHREVSGTPVPIPGEPCRDEHALLADSRIAAGFTLDFSWSAPAQAEDHALRTFAAWLRRVEIRAAPAAPITLADFQAAVEDQVRAAIAHAAGPFANPPLDETPFPDPDPASPGGTASGSPPGAPLVIPREHCAAYLNAAFDVWVRRLRAGAMAPFGPLAVPGADAEAGLLLAALDIELDAGKLRFPPAPGAPALVRWLGRAQLVHLRLLQEWLFTSIENDAPVEADYVLGRGDPRLPAAQDLAVAFALDDHALARIDLEPAPGGGDASAIKAVLRPAVKWPGSAVTFPPDYYGPDMSLPIPVRDGGTGQVAAPQPLQVLVGDGSGEFVLARLADSPTVAVTLESVAGGQQILLNAPGGGIALPLAVNQGGTGQTGSPAPGQLLIGDAAGIFALGQLRPANPARHLRLAQDGADLAIDTTPQVHWATRIVDTDADGLRAEDHVLLFSNTNRGGITFQLGKPQDQRVVVVKATTAATLVRVRRAVGDDSQEPFIDEVPELLVGGEISSATLIGSERLQRWFVLGKA